MFKETIYLAITRFGVMVLGYWLLVALTTYLPISEYGNYAYASALIMTSTPILCFGFQSIILKKIPARIHSKVYLDLFFGIILIHFLFYALIALGLAAAIQVFAIPTLPVLFIWLCIVTSVLIEIINIIFQAIKKSWYSSFLVLGGRQFVLLSVVVALQPTSFEAVLQYYLTASIISLLPIVPYLITHLPRMMRLFMAQKKRIFRVAKQSYFFPGFYFAQVHWASILGLPMQMIIVGALLSAEQFAIYAVSAKVAGMAWIALAPLNRTFVPRFVSVQKHDAQLTQPLLNMTFGLSLLASLPFAVLFFMGGGLLEKWFFANYKGLASVLIIMGIGQVFNCLTGPVIWMVQLTGNEKLWRWVLLASNLASALGVWVSVTVFGMDLLGASILYTLALIIPNTAAFIICVRMLKLNYGIQFKNLLTDLKKYG